MTIKKLMPQPMPQIKNLIIILGVVGLLILPLTVQAKTVKSSLRSSCLEPTIESGELIMNEDSDNVSVAVENNQGSNLTIIAEAKVETTILISNNNTVNSFDNLETEETESPSFILKWKRFRR